MCCFLSFFFRWQTWGCTTVSTLYPISGPHYYYLTSPCPSLHCEHTAATIKDQFLSIWDWMTISYQRTSLCFRQTLFCRSSGQRWCQYLQCLSSTLTAPFQCEAAEDRALLRQLCSLHTPQLSTNQCYYAT